MTGTIIDFLQLAAEKPDLAQELVELAARYGFEFADELKDEELQAVTGGTDVRLAAADQMQSGLFQSLHRLLRTINDLGDTGAASKSGL